MQRLPFRGRGFRRRRNMAERVALYLQDAHELRDGIKYAQYAESKGFEAVWQAESRLVRDAIVPMAAFAASTEKIKAIKKVEILMKKLWR